MIEDYNFELLLKQIDENEYLYREFDDKDCNSVRINLGFKFVNLNRVDYSLRQF